MSKNGHGIDILQAKEMIRREYEIMIKKEASEVALRATRYKAKVFCAQKKAEIRGESWRKMFSLQQSQTCEKGLLRIKPEKGKSARFFIL